MSFAGRFVSLAGGEGGFHAPGPESFDLPPVFSLAGVDVTKPMLLLVLAGLLVFGFFYYASRSRAMVPGKVQFAGEWLYSSVREA